MRFLLPFQYIKLRRKSYDRVKDWAGSSAGSDNIHDIRGENPDVQIVDRQNMLLELFAVLKNLDRSGRPEVIPEDSEANKALGQLATQDEIHSKKPLPEIGKELGISVARSTVEKVIKSCLNNNSHCAYLLNDK